MPANVNGVQVAGIPFSPRNAEYRDKNSGSPQLRTNALETGKLDIPAAPQMFTASTISYEGQDATFTLYGDEDDSYNYETGKYSTLKLSWSESAKQLTISAPAGTYPGMPTDEDVQCRLRRPRITGLASV